MSNLESLLNSIRDCNLCKGCLPFEPNPVLKLYEQASILIVGQAPGLQAHKNNLSWSDRSGDKLREWLDMDKETFYWSGKVAIASMAFCYPGTFIKGGDKPPRPECAKQWHPKIPEVLPNIKTILLIGGYAQKYYLKQNSKITLTETVKDWKKYMPYYFPLPHPSWRNIAWLKKNPWFEKDLIPDLRHTITQYL